MIDYHAFGMRWRSDIPLNEFDPAPPADLAGRSDGKVLVQRVDRVEDRAECRRVQRGWVCSDGVRLPWGDEALFDMTGGTNIAYHPGAGWRGAMPAGFYSTLAALTLAWSGAIPIHGCTVEIAGYAFLIAGPAGAGKSSLAAGLIGAGGRLVADDLSVLRAGPEGGEPLVCRGRRGMRQHAETAAIMAADERRPIAADPTGKWMVYPRARTSADRLPLGGVLLLGGEPAAMGAAERVACLAGQMFRPRWLSALPGHAERRRTIIAIAARVPLAGLAPLEQFDPQTAADRVDRALALIAAMLPASRR